MLRRRSSEKSKFAAIRIAPFAENIRRITELFDDGDPDAGCAVRPSA